MSRRKYAVLLILLLISLNVSAISPVSDQTGVYKTAKATYKDNKINVCTGKVERTWKWTGKGFQTVSIKNQTTGVTYGQIGGGGLCDWDLPGSIDNKSTAELLDVKVTESDDDGFSNKHLQVISTIKYPDSKIEIQHVIWVYPDAPGIRTQLRVKALDGYSSKGIPDKEGERMDCGYKR